MAAPNYIYRTINKEQLHALEGLAYWIADVNYITERWGADDPEHEVAHKTILMLFDKLDELEVPFSIQNAVICYFEEWRNYKRNTTRGFLESRNIHLV